MSRLMKRLADELAVERDEFKVAELVARQAAYLARTGAFDLAREKIARVRATFNDGRSGRVTALLMIAESLLAHFESLGPQARDRIMRAQLLGDVMRDAELIALASAWRAHVEYEASAFDVAALSLRKALGAIDDRNLAARTRCSIVLFNAQSFVGNRTRAQTWFMKGREYALADGDQASIDALLHSKASYGVAHLWVNRCRGQTDEQLLQLTRSEVKSARNLQKLVRIDAHQAFIDLSECNLCVLEGRYEDGLELLRKLKGDGPFPTRHFNQAFALLLETYCLVQVGQTDAALDSFSQTQDAVWSDLDVDDRLIAAWLIHELATADSRFGSVDLAIAALRQADEEHRVEVARVGRVFDEFEPTTTVSR
jgi:tetratricopeptide (TPR) repeat protein